jgi:hypothetical protein
LGIENWELGIGVYFMILKKALIPTSLEMVNLSGEK